jgi:trigger factor
MKFEFDLEVRPEFDLPEWKGLAIDKPVYKYTEKDIDKRVREILGQYGTLVPHDGSAEPGDHVNCNLSFTHDGQEVSRSNEESIRLRPVLSFRDGRIENFDKQMAGVKAGETRELAATISADAPNQALRGKKVAAVVEVLEVKKLELPELTPDFLSELGDFEDEAAFRKAVRDHLERQLEYHQRQKAREQITAKLVRQANWELPEKMLQRQAGRELERSVLELRRNGFSDDRIRAHANELRQNSMAATAKALKEHFILERIAEDEKIEAGDADYDKEIDLIADQSNESPRRVRARLEKRGLMDVLRNQIIEHKVIDLVLKHAKFTETPYTPSFVDAEAVDYSAGGGDRGEDIPTATKPGEPEALKTPDMHG